MINKIIKSVGLFNVKLDGDSCKLLKRVFLNACRSFSLEREREKEYILNPCIHCLFSDASSDGQRLPSFNGELNGLLGAAGLLGSTDRSTMSESSRPLSTDISAQETQIM